LAEAALYGKPVVASRLGAMAELVDDGKTGLLFEPGNAEDLARKIKILWDDPELCHHLGEAGRKKALQEYSSDKYYERLMTVYKKAIDNSHGVG
jgi:glycosyltransferase involved in cell wall biosynthesis